MARSKSTAPGMYGRSDSAGAATQTSVVISARHAPSTTFLRMHRIGTHWLRHQIGAASGRPELHGLLLGCASEHPRVKRLRYRISATISRLQPFGRHSAAKAAIASCGVFGCL